MPKRRVRNKSWEVESERMIITPAIKRRIWRGVVTRAIKTLDAFSQLNSEECFSDLPGAAMAAYYLGRYSEASELAQRSLEIAQSHRENWNYGNAIHFGHTVHGLLALRNRDIKTAIASLQESANTKGSPQLGSFGPTMLLAKELLELGKSAEVLEFLHQCRGFWAMGDKWIDIWEKKIRHGAIPNFFMNLYR